MSWCVVCCRQWHMWSGVGVKTKIIYGQEIGALCCHKFMANLLSLQSQNRFSSLSNVMRHWTYGQNGTRYLTLMYNWMHCFASEWLRSPWKNRAVSAAQLSVIDGSFSLENVENLLEAESFTWIKLAEFGPEKFFACMCLLLFNYELDFHKESINCIDWTGLESM